MFKRFRNHSSKSADRDGSSDPTSVGLTPPPITKERPANFDSPDYKPCGMDRIVFKERALGEVNSIFLIDDSSSTVMREFVSWNEPLNWDVMTSVAPLLFDIIAQNDPDGACLYFLNHKSNRRDEPGVPEDGLARTGYNRIQNPEYMMHLMNKVRPEPNKQGTPTGDRIKDITDAYLDRCANKRYPALPRPINLIVWTDGRSDNDEYLKAVIVKICRRMKSLGLPHSQIGIQFYQVGKLPGVSVFLKSLDNGLKEAEDVDIVDTRDHKDIGDFNAEGLAQLLLGSFVKQIDNKDKYGNAPASTGDEWEL